MNELLDNLGLLITAGVAFAAFVAFALLAKPGLTVLAVGACLLLSSIGVALDYQGRPYRTWLFSVQAYRSEIFTAVGALIIFGVLGGLSAGRTMRVGAQQAALIMIVLYDAFSRLLHGAYIDSALTAALAVFALVPIVFASRMYMGSFGELLRFLRVVAMINAVWIGAVLVQIVINPSVIVVGQGLRFSGILGNPQHTAIMFCFHILVLIFLLLHDPDRRRNVIWITLLGLSAAMLIWTGSRTGALTCTLGAMYLLRRRAGRAILLLPLVVGVVYGVIEAIGSFRFDLGAERLLSTQNTRAEAWRMLWNRFTNNPLFGAGPGEAGASENSLLLGLASYGVIMGVLVLFFYFVTTLAIWRAMRAARSMPHEYAMFIDLVVAFNIAYVLGSLSEGYLLARIGAPLVFMIIFASLLHAATVLARRDLALQNEHDPHGQTPVSFSDPTPG